MERFPDLRATASANSAEVGDSMSQLLQQASRLVELLSGRARDGAQDVVARGIILARELMHAGEWRASKELAEACRSKTELTSVRIESDVLRAECLAGIGEFGSSHEILSRVIRELEQSDAPSLQLFRYWASVLQRRALWGMHRLDDAEQLLSPSYNSLSHTPHTTVL